MPFKNQRPSSYTECISIRETISQYYLFHKTNGHSQETLRYYEYHLGRIAEWLEGINITDISEITVQVLRDYFTQYQKGHTRNGANVQYRAVKAYLRWVWDEYDLEYKNPIEKIRVAADPVVPIKGVDPADIEKLFESAKRSDYPERDCALLAVLLDTGIRKSSFINIRKEDVNTVNGTIYIRHCKNHKPMTVYLGKTARKHIRNYLKTIPFVPSDDYFWVTEYGDPLSMNGMREVLRRMCNRAGIPEYSAHDFRRYFALQSYRNGADIYAVSELLGHSGIEVTKRYLAINDDDRRLVHARTSPLDLNGKTRSV